MSVKNESLCVCARVWNAKNTARKNGDFDLSIFRKINDDDDYDALLE